ncbi:holin [Paenibacillus sp. 1011MAR3C5]|uniref:phage holin family protein n=1 Tax=Paenibacillus sp. 1011MAR3C5 TaxID=1675787 RepID=UPI000E6C39CF|nr:phage holin family protein [Paenibacillus sp. 1011MAR3C5]RJE84264.1 holin [Paenibacillus sp. 1011MAR3C5]
MINEFIQYVTEEALVLMPVLFIMGLLLKNTPRVPNWTIPWALLAIGMTGGIVIVGSPVQGIIQGVLVTGATVLTHQLVKQTTDK